MFYVDIILEWFLWFLKRYCSPCLYCLYWRCWNVQRIEAELFGKKILSDHLLFAVDRHGQLLSSWKESSTWCRSSHVYIQLHFDKNNGQLIVVKCCSLVCIANCMFICLLPKLPIKFFQ